MCVSGRVLPLADAPPAICGMELSLRHDRPDHLNFVGRDLLQIRGQFAVGHSKIFHHSASQFLGHGADVSIAVGHLFIGHGDGRALFQDLPDLISIGSNAGLDSGQHLLGSLEIPRH